jgi:ABC-type Na+ transport system ATPase subunit NatA
VVNGRSNISYTKKNEITDYRPVTCLPTIYKLLTSVISRRMQQYMDDGNLIPKERKRCRRGSKGCKDQLLISKAILQKCKSKIKKCVSHGLIIRNLVTGSHKVV